MKIPNIRSYDTNALDVTRTNFETFPVKSLNYCFGGQLYSLFLLSYIFKTDVRVHFNDDGLRGQLGGRQKRGPVGSGWEQQVWAPRVGRQGQGKRGGQSLAKGGMVRVLRQDGEMKGGGKFS